MNELIEEVLTNKSLDNESLIFRAKASLKGAPDGSLRILNSKEKYKQYYCYKKSEKDEYPNGRYIKKKDLELARRLAQKDYDKAVIKACYKQNRLINSFLKDLGECDGDEIYESMNLLRKELVTPWHENEENRIAHWYETHRSCANPYPLEEVYVNSAGMQMRSKSEVIISEILLRMGLPFVYEPELIMQRMKKYPDFAIFSVKDGRTIYLEHFGMMDNPEYADNNVRKINEYISAGYVLGENLLFTFESRSCPINVKSIELMISNCLK